MRYLSEGVVETCVACRASVSCGCGGGGVVTRGGQKIDLKVGRACLTFVVAEKSTA